MKIFINKQFEKLFRSEKGMTLMELAVGVAVSGIIMVSILPFIKVNVNSYVKARQGKDIIQSSRIGFSRMIAELRQIEESTEIDYGYSDRIQFDLPGESNITYRFENGQLTREGDKVVDSVVAMTIKYYKADGSEKSSGFYYASDVWRISIEMTVGDADNQFTLRSQVSPRAFHY